ncbi:MAG: 1,4-dihydroxy-2-naphthoate octaprenyltransferase [Chloroflexi bacterium]|nr:1,4-dihydroxy-2-naphthoate octaprenyltransferase [Chloroflexota bacterium]
MQSPIPWPAGVRRKLSLWREELRVPFFTATFLPILLGALIAWERGYGFQWGYFLLTLLWGTLLHAGTNVANDYFDHLSGADEQNYEFVRPFTGGSRMIQRRLLSPREVLVGALLFFALGSLIGLSLAYVRGWPILALGLVGVLSGFFYTAPPVRLSSRGIGELFVGLNFGILMTLGSYYVQAQQLDLEPLWASLPLATLIAAVLYINEFQDLPADRAADKHTLVVRLGRPRAVSGYILLMVATYGSIATAVLLGHITPFALLALATIPIALFAIRVARANYEDYIRLAPANAATVFVHLLTGILLALAYLLEGWV